MRRLSVVDEIFLRTHQGLGTPIALQGLWRTAAAVEPALLAGLHEALRTGPLARRVVRPRVPGARSRWQDNERAHPLDHHDEAIRPETVPAWADTRGIGLDPERGPGWRLSVAPLTDGGTVLALTCSHVLADARGLLIAVERALATADTGSTAAPGTATRRWSAGAPGSATTGAPDVDSDRGVESDWVDAARIWTTVARGGLRAAASRLPRGMRSPAPEQTSAVERADAERSAGAELPGPPARSAVPEPVASDTVGLSPSRSARLCEPAVILRCPAAEWERIAAECGGTANSLFIWLVANTLWAAGFPAPEIAASLPIDTRDEPLIDNDLAMTEIVVTPGDGPAAIRAKSRAAYARRMSGPAALPEEFLYLVPDKVAHLLSRGAGERDILCSNIGPIPPALSALGPHECTGLATRAIHPGLTAAGRPRTRLSGYLCRFRDDYILTLASLYPEHLADPAALHRSAVATAARRGLPIRPW